MSVLITRWLCLPTENNLCIIQTKVQSSFFSTFTSLIVCADAEFSLLISVTPIKARTAYLHGFHAEKLDPFCVYWLGKFLKESGWMYFDPVCVCVSPHQHKVAVLLHCILAGDADSSIVIISQLDTD